MKTYFRQHMIVAADAVVAVLFFVMANAAAFTIHDEFKRSDSVAFGADPTQPVPGNVVEFCGGEYPQAKAFLKIKQADDLTAVTIKLTDARPTTFYTVWLRLQGTDRFGAGFGGSPVTGAGSTPLTPYGQFGALVDATILPYLPGAGSDEAPNGFYTDENGNGLFKTVVESPLIEGAYQFQHANLAPAQQGTLFTLFPNARLIPQAIVIPDGIHMSAPWAPGGFSLYGRGWTWTHSWVPRALV